MSKKPTYEELGQRIKALEESESERKQAEEENKILSKMPSENPHPVLRVQQDGKIIYANEASNVLLQTWRSSIGENLPTSLCDLVYDIYKDIRINEIELNAGDQIFSLVIVPITGAGLLNIYGRDITERKQAEEEIRAAEENLKNTFDTSPSIICKADLNTSCFIEANQAVTRLLGYSVEEFTSRPFMEFIHPDDRQQSVDESSDQLKGKETTFFENRYLCKDGSYKWLAWHGTKADENGIVTAIGSDISERKLAEIQLIESEEKLKIIIDTSPIGICTVDGLGKFTTTNLAYEQMIGYSKEECRDLSLFNVTHPSDRPKNKKLFQSMFSMETSGFSLEKRYIRKDGEVIDVAIHAIGIRDADGNVRFGTAFVEDITERKLADEALSVAYDALDTSVNGVIITDLEGMIKYANPAFLSMFEYKDVEQVKGKPASKLFPSEEVQKFSDVAAIIDKTKGETENFRARHEDDTIFHVEVSSSTVTNKEGKDVGRMASFVDITERKQAEEEHERLQKQLQQAQKMESVGRLAGGVAHDYNNISSIIIGYSELALDNVEQSDPLYGDLMEILTAAKRSTDITQQLLAFARKQTIVPKVLDLNDAIGDLLKMLQRLIGEDVDFAWIPEAEIRPMKMDPSQINQIMANLCVNARDAIANVGRITVETKNVKLDKDDCFDHEGAVPGEYIQLSVTDDGCGMTPETQDNIFEPFFTTKGVGKGTGLGLSTVYGIVKQNNGFINVYSEPEKGTTFRVYLPIYVGQIVKEHSEKTIELSLSRGETVLLVEDDESILKIVKRILEKLGYAVLFAISPMEAVSLAAEHAGEINLLITDVVLPEMNGRELAERLQSLYPNLKTLFMSGYTADIIAKRGELESGVNFIEKPFSNKDLAFKVREVLDEGEES